VAGTAAAASATTGASAATASGSATAARPAITARSATASGSATAARAAATANAGSSDSSGLPAHILMGYWQDFTNGAENLTLADVPTSYNLVAVAFGTATSTPGQVAFSLDPTLASDLGGYTQAQFTSDIATLHSRGQKVILSVGGQNGAISVDDAASAANFASSVYSLIQQYGFDGVDIDLENGVNPTYMASALEQLESDVGSSLIITLAPQTVDTQSTGDDYFALALDIQPILTMINTQYYNSGSMNGCDGNVYSEGTENFITALACTELEGGLSPSQVGIGLPASSSAAGSGYVAPSVADDALDCLAARANCGTFTPSSAYPGIRGAMTWSINWDASNGYAFADTVAPYLSTLP
jgi:chitinase